MAVLTPILLRIARTVVLLALTLGGTTASATLLLDGQPYDRLLSTATATMEAGTLTLVIDAVTPLQYDWHFPGTPATKVIIAVRLSSTPHDAGGRSYYREHLVVPPAARGEVQDISFDNSDGHGNFLVLHLTQAATITVSPGATAFQLRIAIQYGEGDN